MKKILTMLLAFAMLPLVCFSAGAAGNNNFLHSYYAVEGNNLVVFGSQLPENGTVSATLASQSVSKAAFETLSDTERPVTLYCIVDTSTAMSSQILEKGIEILTGVNAMMDESDIMVITTVGDTIEEGEPLTTFEEREAAIGAIVSSGKQTDLYQAVKQALESLTTKKNYTQNKFLLVFSDGVDDGRTSITEEALLTEIEKSTLPVFGIGMLQNYPSDYSRKLAQSLTRMAEGSVGGVYYDTSASGHPAVQIASEIWGCIENAAVLTINFSNMNTQGLGDTVKLNVRYETEDVVYEDDVDILTADLLPHVARPMETIPQTDAQEEEPEGSVLLIVAAGCAALLLITGAGVFLILRRKKHAASARNVSGQRAVECAPVTTPATVSSQQAGRPELGTVKQEAERFPVQEKPARKLNVHMTVLGHADQFFDFQLPEGEGVTIGREDCSDVVLMIGGETDSKLSAQHCAMCWEKGRLFVTDKKSTNGTFVNGVKLIPGVFQQLENNATLRIGSREYRVSLSVQE